jgi:hypothetical protein
MASMIRPTLRLLAVASALAASACGDEERTLDRHVEDLVTIDQGVYGQITSVSDVGPSAADYLPGFTVEVYVVPVGTERGTPVASTASEASRGFYKVSLSAGDHLVCTASGSCVVVTLAAGEVLRLDYESGPGPGWSRGTSWPAAQ